MQLVIGHSWVRRLSDLAICGDDFVLWGQGGATFSSFIPQVRGYFARPGRRVPEQVFVFLGSNDIDKVRGTAEVWKVVDDCKAFCKVLRECCPGARLVFSQVEDRYAKNHLEDSRAILRDFKAKSNKFNKWLNKWEGRDDILLIKGKGRLSVPSLYARDGVHLNYAGNERLAQLLRDF